MASPSPAGARLARQLRDLRRASHTTGSAFARRLQWSQSRVSKIETGAKVPSRAELSAWIDQAGADQSTASTLWRAWDGARSEQAPQRRSTTTPARPRDLHGYPECMIERVQRDMHATTIMEYRPALLPSTLTTAEYLRAVFRSHLADLFDLDDEQVERTLAQRDRQQRRLLEGRTAVACVLEETALYNEALAPQVLVRQLDRLRELTYSLPNLDLAVMPFSAGPVPMPSTSFAIHDREQVHVPGLGRDFVVDEPTEVALWVRAFATAQQRAARGREALALIDEAKRTLVVGMQGARPRGGSSCARASGCPLDKTA